MDFRRDFDGMVTTLGVSDLLYNSNLLLYDRKSKSLWSQVMGKQSTAREKMNTWFLYRSNIQHGRTVETASADKSSLPWHRFNTRLWALSLQWLWLKWGHLFCVVLPKLSVPSKRLRDWNRNQWKLQSLSFCRIIPKKNPHWKTCWWASKLF